MAGTRTLEPGRKLYAVNARCKAAVPELTPTEQAAPIYSLHSFSNWPTNGPRPSQARSNTDRIFASSSSPTQGLNNLTSILGLSCIVNLHGCSNTRGIKRVTPPSSWLLRQKRILE